MKFNIFSELTYEVTAPTTFILNIHAAKTQGQYIIEESLTTNPELYLEIFTQDSSGARFIRLEINEPHTFTITYKAIVDVYHKIIGQEKLEVPFSITRLEHAAIPYLNPSRHCQSDKISKLAVKEFSCNGKPYTQVLAINEWIYNHVDYLTDSTNSGTSACDTLTQRVGVCKDFAHLGIALCRALDVPARYYTGYATNLFPPDFHACYEAYIGGEWIFFDATRLVPLNGLVKIANGKDAAEVAVASFFGKAACTFRNVQCYPFGTEFIPYVVPQHVEGLSYY